MSRLIYALGALGMSSGIVAVSSPSLTPPNALPAQRVQVVGNLHPLNLGGAMVTATALPASR